MAQDDRKARIISRSAINSSGLFSTITTPAYYNTRKVLIMNGKNIIPILLIEIVSGRAVVTQGGATTFVSNIPRNNYLNMIIVQREAILVQTS